MGSEMCIRDRATTDNDRGNRHDFRCSEWLTAGLSQKAQSFEIKEEADKVTLTFEYLLPTSVKTTNTVEYTVTPDGRIHVKA